jgi:hypothetical protein
MHVLQLRDGGNQQLSAPGIPEPDGRILAQAEELAPARIELHLSDGLVVGQQLQQTRIGLLRRRDPLAMDLLVGRTNRQRTCEPEQRARHVAGLQGALAVRHAEAGVTIGYDPLVDAGGDAEPGCGDGENSEQRRNDGECPHPFLVLPHEAEGAAQRRDGLGRRARCQCRGRLLDPEDLGRKVARERSLGRGPGQRAVEIDRHDAPPGAAEDGDLANDRGGQQGGRRSHQHELSGAPELPRPHRLPVVAGGIVIAVEKDLEAVRAQPSRQRVGVGAAVVP